MDSRRGYDTRNPIAFGVALNFSIYEQVVQAQIEPTGTLLINAANECEELSPAPSSKNIADALARVIKPLILNHLSMLDRSKRY
jgi:hypothetical protein